MERSNPAELQAQKLARSGGGGEGDARAARPDLAQRRALAAILAYPPNRYGCRQHVPACTCMHLPACHGLFSRMARIDYLVAPPHMAQGFSL